ncbi:MAG: hypothetical protein WBD28_04670 [Candidatus Zixiibacteriota bacterium]
MKILECKSDVWFLIIILILLGSCFEVRGDELTVYSSADDAYLREVDPDYNTARNDSCADYHNTEIGIHRFGQVYSGGNYYLPRSYLVFNTGSLGSQSILDSAKLFFYIEWLDTSDHWDMIVVEGFWDTDPPEACDFKTGVWIGEQSGGSKNTSGISAEYNSVTLNSTGLGWINKTGTTRLALRSNRDINGTPPPGSEQIQHRSADYYGTDNDPYLEIWYHTGVPPEGVNRLLTKRQQRK